MEQMTDTEWSRKIICRDNRCRWPNCDLRITPFNRLTAHHGIGRKAQWARHDERNGITLCVTHHGKAETKPHMWRMSDNLIGRAWIASGGFAHLPGDFRDTVDLLTPEEFHKMCMNLGVKP